MCIFKNIEFANFVATSILSLLLIGVTIIISRRQNKLQKNLNDQQSQLQRNITERETKISLYQYRMNCYAQIMEALDIVAYEKLEDYVANFQTGGLDVVKKISEGRKMMLKAYIESETLFDEEVVTYIGGLYLKYNSLYSRTCDMHMIPDDEHQKRRVILEQKIGFTSDDSRENILAKYVAFVNTKEGADFFKEVVPEIVDCLALSKDLADVFRPNNKLFRLVKDYIDVKELNRV